jgi:hypothetical protein
MKTSIICEIFFLFNDITGRKLGMTHPDQKKYPDIYYCKGDNYSERYAKLRVKQKELIEKNKEIIEKQGEIIKELSTDIQHLLTEIRN